MAQLPSTSTQTPAMQRLLDGVEKIGNVVPHPAAIFLILNGIAIVFSAKLSLFSTRIQFEHINPKIHEIEKGTTEIRRLLNSDGIRFICTSLVPTFMSLTAHMTHFSRKNFEEEN